MAFRSSVRNCVMYIINILTTHYTCLHVFIICFRDMIQTRARSKQIYK